MTDCQAGKHKDSFPEGTVGISDFGTLTPENSCPAMLLRLGKGVAMITKGLRFFPLQWTDFHLFDLHRKLGASHKIPFTPAVIPAYVLTTVDLLSFSILPVFENRSQCSHTEVYVFIKPQNKMTDASSDVKKNHVSVQTAYALITHIRMWKCLWNLRMVFNSTMRMIPPHLWNSDGYKHKWLKRSKNNNKYLLSVPGTREMNKNKTLLVTAFLWSQWSLLTSSRSGASLVSLLCYLFCNLFLKLLL